MSQLNGQSEDAARVFLQIWILLLIDAYNERVALLVLFGVSNEVTDARRQRHSLTRVFHSQLLDQLLELVDVARHDRSVCRGEMRNKN